MIARKFFSILIASVAVSAGAKEWHVDVNADPAVADGTSAHPYVTIQAAVNAAASSDEIVVGPGVYDSGEHDSSLSVGKARVVIDGKDHLVIRASAGPDKTFVVGTRAATASGCGTGAVRCFIAADASGTVIDGFTICGGATVDSTGDSGKAGALYADGRHVYLYDCVVSNCTAQVGGGALVGGTVLRTLVSDCKTARTTSVDDGDAAYGTLFVNSVVAHNGDITVKDRPTLVRCRAINTTFADNGGLWAMNKGDSSDATFEKDVYNCVFVYSGTARETNAVTSVNTVCGLVAPHGEWQLLSPTAGDWHLLPTSDAVGAGDPAVLSTLGEQMTAAGVPAEYDPFVDYAGTAIAKTGAIDAGALQGCVTPAGGALYFAARTRIDGNLSRKATYAYPATYPKQYVVEPLLDSGKYAFHYERTCGGAVNAVTLPHVFPRLDGKAFVLMPPADVTKICTNKLVQCSRVYWVSPDGSDAADGSELTPWRTLTNACAHVSGGSTLILAKPGVYREGSVACGTYGNFRLYPGQEGVYIRSVAGPEETTIEGAPDPDTLDAGEFPGCGPKAVKGVALNTSKAFLQGFTIRNCYGGAKNESEARRMHVAVYVQNNSQLADCIIRDCHSCGSVIGGAHLSRCRVYANTSSNGLHVCAQNNVRVWVSSCDYAGNTNGTASGGTDGFLNGRGTAYSVACQCTFAGDSTKNRGLLGAQTVSYNSICDGGQFLFSAALLTNCVVWNVNNTSSSKSTFTKADPLFADRSTSGRLLSVSPGVGLAERPTDGNYGADFWRFATADVEGNLITAAPDGRLTVGAYQKTLACVRVTLAAITDGGLSVSGLSVGENLIGENAGEIVFTPDAGTRPCVGMTVNGTTNLFEAATGHRIVLTGADFLSLADDGTVAVAPLYTADWYVDAENGNDANSGFYPSAAKRTLAAAACKLASGDTLHALPGRYDEGTMTNNPARAGHERVVLKSGTKLVSTDGPEVTVIVGAGECPLTGLDSNAVRCVYLKENTLLEGFTLTGGRAASFAKYQETGYDEEDAAGGAVLGESTSYRVPSSGVVVKNCFLTNNKAYSGGAAMRCQLVDCRVENNVSSDDSATAYQASAYGCWFAGNTGGFIFRWSANVMNTTATPDNRTSAGATAKAFSDAGFSPADRARIFNSCLGGSLHVKDAKVDVCNTVFIDENSQLAVADGYLFANNVGTNAAAMAFTDAGMPVIGVNPSVDRGDPSLVEDYYLSADVDLAGNQRIWNAVMDSGCFEADWRGVYAAVLGRSVTVTRADPEVVMDGKCVLLANGVLETVWAARDPLPVGRRFTVLVTGTGVLAVRLNGEAFAEVTAEDGEKTMTFENALPSNELAFEYEPGSNDTGCARISSFRTSRGMILIVR